MLYLREHSMLELEVAVWELNWNRQVDNLK